MSEQTPTRRQRLDKWLWFARVVKTRTLAAKLVASGHIRVNSTRVDAPAHQLKAGDVLTIALEREVRILKMLEPGERRGPYEEARLLFEDLSPPPEPKEARIVPDALREPGSGRPTKKDRRDNERFREGE